MSDTKKEETTTVTAAPAETTTEKKPAATESAPQEEKKHDVEYADDENKGVSFLTSPPKLFILCVKFDKKQVKSVS